MTVLKWFSLKPSENIKDRWSVMHNKVLGRSQVALCCSWGFGLAANTSLYDAVINLASVLIAITKRSAARRPVTGDGHCQRSPMTTRDCPGR